MVSRLLVFHPAVLKLIEMITSGVLGKINYSLFQSFKLCKSADRRQHPLEFCTIWCSGYYSIIESINFV